MRPILTAAIIAIGLGLSGAAHAATKTFQATFSNVSDSNGALAALGADPAATELLLTWTIDTSAAPIAGPYNYSWRGLQFSYAFLPYTSLSMTIGGVTLAGTPSGSTNDRIIVLDGISNGSSNIYDYYQVGSFSDQTLSNGTTVSDMYFFTYNYDHSTLSGLDHPSEQELTALGDGTSGIRINLVKADGQRATLFGNSSSDDGISVVPVPASMPLLLGALLLLGLYRRRS